jgi:hypothetical protein
MEMTIPFALSWGAVLTAVSAGVALYDKKLALSKAEVKNGKPAESKKAEETK